jgi:hypothetical protein
MPDVEVWPCRRAGGVSYGTVGDQGFRTEGSVTPNSAARLSIAARARHSHASLACKTQNRLNKNCH